MLAEQQVDTVVVRAPAKVNLFLEVLGKRPDGYHEIVTFLAAVRLCDILEFTEESSGDIRLTCNDPALPVGPENLIWRAADLLRRRAGVDHGVHIHLTKRIPAAAGLAGGSSDAAATFQGLNQLWGLRLATPELMDLASRLGSDIPFFFATPAAWCTGRGEHVMPAPLITPLHLVLACPGVGLATAEVYRGVTVPAAPCSPEALRRALAGGEPEAIGAALHNRLQPVAERLCPEVAVLRDLFVRLAPAGHLMSGSGSCYFAVCRSRAEAEHLARRVRQWYTDHRPEEGQGLRIFVVESFTLQDAERGGKDQGPEPLRV
jgi:4-diphosphocytidyl-2-C-methyl-D-erythritol kinase